MIKVNAIFNLLQPFVKNKLLLYRSKKQIARQLGDFITIEKNDKIIACCGLRKHKNCYELYAFAINKKYHNKGIGGKLLELAEKKSTGNLIALSKYGGAWFLKNNFSLTGVYALDKTIKYNKVRKPLVFIKKINNAYKRQNKRFFTSSS